MRLVQQTQTSGNIAENSGWLGVTIAELGIQEDFCADFIAERHAKIQCLTNTVFLAFVEPEFCTNRKKRMEGIEQILVWKAYDLTPEGDTYRKLEIVCGNGVGFCFRDDWQ